MAAAHCVLVSLLEGFCLASGARIGSRRKALILRENEGLFFKNGRGEKAAGSLLFLGCLLPLLHRAFGFAARYKLVSRSGEARPSITRKLLFSFPRPK